MSDVYSLNATVNREEVASELKRLGRFAPKDVVKAARPKSSPLHKYFEWDDSKAADEFRLQQARMLVISIRIESDNNIRAYESVVLEGKRLYVPIEEIKSDKSLYDQVLEAAMSEIIFWREKYQRYENLFGRIFDEIKIAEEAYRRKSNGKEKAGRAKTRGRGKNKHSSNKKTTGNNNNNWSVTTSR